MPLALSQARRQIENLGCVLTTQLFFHCGEACRFRRVTLGCEVRIGCNHQSNAVRVIDQQVTDKRRDIGRIFHPLAQRIDDRLKIERGNCIAVMGGGTECPQHEVQAIGHAIAAHFALMELNLSQNGIDLVCGDTLVGDALDTGHQFALKGIGLSRFAALDATAEDHLAHRLLKAAKRRGGSAPICCLEIVHEWRGAVFHEH